MKKRILATLVCLTLSPVIADTVTTNMNASASVNNTCSLSVTNVAFGDYDPSAIADQTSSQTVEILCTRGTGWKFYTGASDVNNDNQYSSMKFGSYKLLYQMQLINGNWENDGYSNAALNPSYTYTGTGTGAKQNIGIAYRIKKNQYVPVGNYVDNAVAYIQF